MKYYIGNKFSKKPELEEETMALIGVEKEDKQNDNELKSKIKEEICRNKIDIKNVVTPFNISNADFHSIKNN